MRLDDFNVSSIKTAKIDLVAVMYIPGIKN